MTAAAPARTLVVIDGVDGSGKSTFARRLRDALAAEAVAAIIVSVDDFRRPVDWAAAAASPDGEAGAYYDAYYDLAACDRCLAAFAAGAASLAVPQFDSVGERAAAPREVACAGAAIAILEGVFPLRVPAASAGVVIYLDTAGAEARRRIVERDLAKGRTRTDIERRIDRRYAPGQARYHAALDPRGRADVIVGNDRPTAARALRRDVGRADPAVRGALDRALDRLLKE